MLGILFTAILIVAILTMDLQGTGAMNTGIISFSIWVGGR
jgi:hypothetical protein